MKPLYRYKFYEESGDFESETITEYEERMWFGRKEYRYKMNGSIRVVKESNLDKYVYEQVHSFNPDHKKAKATIFSTLKAKYLRAHYEAEKYKQLMEKVKRL